MFHCAECGREVKMGHARPGMTWDVGDGVARQIPETIELPVCECGEFYVTCGLAEEIEAKILSQLAEEREMNVDQGIKEDGDE